MVRRGKRNQVTVFTLRGSLGSRHVMQLLRETLLLLQGDDGCGLGATGRGGAAAAEHEPTAAHKRYSLPAALIAAPAFPNACRPLQQKQQRQLSNGEDHHKPEGEEASSYPHGSSKVYASSHVSSLPTTRGVVYSTSSSPSSSAADGVAAPASAAVPDQQQQQRGTAEAAAAPAWGGGGGLQRSSGEATATAPANEKQEEDEEDKPAAAAEGTAAGEGEEAAARPAGVEEGGGGERNQRGGGGETGGRNSSGGSASSRGSNSSSTRSSSKKVALEEEEKKEKNEKKKNDKRKKKKEKDEEDDDDGDMIELSEEDAAALQEKMEALASGRRRWSLVEVNLSDFPERRAEALQLTNSFYFPQVFFNNFLVGGVEKIEKLHATGRLRLLLLRWLDNYAYRTDASHPAAAGPAAAAASPFAFSRHSAVYEGGFDHRFSSINALSSRGGYTTKGSIYGGVAAAGPAAVSRLNFDTPLTFYQRASMAGRAEEAAKRAAAAAASGGTSPEAGAATAAAGGSRRSSSQQRPFLTSILRFSLPHGKSLAPRTAGAEDAAAASVGRQGGSVRQQQLEGEEEETAGSRAAALGVGSPASAAATARRFGAKSFSFDAAAAATPEEVRGGRAAGEAAAAGGGGGTAGGESNAAAALTRGRAAAGAATNGSSSSDRRRSSRMRSASVTVARDSYAAARSLASCPFCCSLLPGSLGPLAAPVLLPVIGEGDTAAAAVGGPGYPVSTPHLDTAASSSPGDVGDSSSLLLAQEQRQTGAATTDGSAAARAAGALPTAGSSAAAAAGGGASGGGNTLTQQAAAAGGGAAGGGGAAEESGRLTLLQVAPRAVEFREDAAMTPTLDGATQLWLQQQHLQQLLYMRGAATGGGRSSRNSYSSQLSGRLDPRLLPPSLSLRRAASAREAEAVTLRDEFHAGSFWIPYVEEKNTEEEAEEEEEQQKRKVEQEMEGKQGRRAAAAEEAEEDAVDGGGGAAAAGGREGAAGGKRGRKREAGDEAGVQDRAAAAGGGGGGGAAAGGGGESSSSSEQHPRASEGFRAAAAAVAAVRSKGERLLLRRSGGGGGGGGARGGQQQQQQQRSRAAAGRAAAGRAAAGDSRGRGGRGGEGGGAAAGSPAGPAAGTTPRAATAGSPPRAATAAARQEGTGGEEEGVGGAGGTPAAAERRRGSAAAAAAGKKGKQYIVVEMPDGLKLKKIGYCELLRLLQKILPISDHTHFFRIHRHCFTGSEAVDAFVTSLRFPTREAAVQFGCDLVQQSVIHLVGSSEQIAIFSESPTAFYRLQLHAEPFVLNWSVIWRKPPAAGYISIVRHLFSSWIALQEAHRDPKTRLVSQEGMRQDSRYLAFQVAVCELQTVDLLTLKNEAVKKAFLINVCNLLAQHALVEIGVPADSLSRTKFFSSVSYCIGGFRFTLNEIENGLLRCNRRNYYSLTKPFGFRDQRLQFALAEFDPRIHFALTCGARSSPPLRFYEAESIDEELRIATEVFCASDQNVKIDIPSHTLWLNKVFGWYDGDFGSNSLKIASFVAAFLHGSKRTKLLTLINSSKGSNAGGAPSSSSSSSAAAADMEGEQTFHSGGDGFDDQEQQQANEASLPPAAATATAAATSSSAGSPTAVPAAAAGGGGGGAATGGGGGGGGGLTFLNRILSRSKSSIAAWENSPLGHAASLLDRAGSTVGGGGSSSTTLKIKHFEFDWTCDNLSVTHRFRGGWIGDMVGKVQGSTQPPAGGSGWTRTAQSSSSYDSSSSCESSSSSGDSSNSSSSSCDSRSKEAGSHSPANQKQAVQAPSGPVSSSSSAAGGGSSADAAADPAIPPFPTGPAASLVSVSPLTANSAAGTDGPAAAAPQAASPAALASSSGKRSTGGHSILDFARRPRRREKAQQQHARPARSRKIKTAQFPRIKTGKLRRNRGSAAAAAGGAGAATSAASAAGRNGTKESNMLYVLPQSGPT